MLSIFRPHLRVASVLDLSTSWLRRLGLDHLLLDVDCTLKAYRDEQPSAEISAWLEAVRQQFQIVLISNGRAQRIGRFADSLDLPFLAEAMKPLPRKLRRAMRQHKMDPRRTAMIGDQLFADVMAARLAGVMSILVEAIHPEQERWFSRVKRAPQHLVLRLQRTPLLRDSEESAD